MLIFLTDQELFCLFVALKAQKCIIYQYFCIDKAIVFKVKLHIWILKIRFVNKIQEENFIITREQPVFGDTENIYTQKGGI